MSADADFFYPLSPRQTMLLSMLFVHGDESSQALLELLPDDDLYPLQEKAELLSSLEAEQRMAVVLSEIRRLVGFSAPSALSGIDASWLLAALRGERPQTIGILLSQMDGAARKRALAALPDNVRAKIPDKSELQKVKPELTRIVRQSFAAKFVSMPTPPRGPAHFYLRDVALLEGLELIQLVRALGVDELAAAFLAVGKRKLAELCHRLGNQAAEELMVAVRETESRDAMDLEGANEFLKRLLVGAHAEEDEAASRERFQKELFQKAGLYRLAKALSSERPAIVQQVAQRLPRSHGRLLRNYVYRSTESGALPESKLHRLQDLVLFRVEKLAARGKVNPKYLKFVFCYWGEEGADGDLVARVEPDDLADE